MVKVIDLTLRAIKTNQEFIPSFTYLLETVSKVEIIKYWKEATEFATITIAIVFDLDFEHEHYFAN